jgi:hypothetical protein
MKRIWIASMLTLVVAAVAAAPAGAAGNSDNAKLCQKGGWQNLFRSDGSTFKNQGDCISYGAHGNTFKPNAWEAACLRAGGTFSVSDTNIFGDTFTPPAFVYNCVSEPPTTPPGGDPESGLDAICIEYPDWFETDFHSDAAGVEESCVRSGTT